MDDLKKLSPDEPVSREQLLKNGGTNQLADNPISDGARGTGFQSPHLESRSSDSHRESVANDQVRSLQQIVKRAACSGGAAVRKVSQHPVQLAASLIGLGLLVTALRRVRSR